MRKSFFIATLLIAALYGGSVFACEKCYHYWAYQSERWCEDCQYYNCGYYICELHDETGWGTMCYETKNASSTLESVSADLTSRA